MTGQIVSGWESENRFVTVEKVFERPERRIVMVTFTITSTADKPMGVRIVDDLPEPISGKAVGFHPTYKLENWSVHKDDSVELVDGIAPGETRYAFYYLEIEDPDALGRLGPPTIADATPIESGDVTAYDPSTLRRSGSALDSKRTVGDGPLPGILTAGSGTEVAHGTSKGSSGTAETDADYAAAVDGGYPAADAGDDASNALADDPSPPPSGGPSEVSEDASGPTNDDAPAVFAALQDEYDRCEYDEFGDEVERYYPSDVDFAELIGIDEDDPSSTGSDEDAATVDDDDGASVRSEGDEDASSEANSPDETQLETARPETAFQWTGDAAQTETGEDVLAALRRELEGADPSDDEMAALRKALGVDVSGHRAVQIRHLQSQVADLAAYVDALEAFLDEEGPAATVLSSLRDDVDRVHDRLDRIAAQVDETSDRQADLRERIEGLERAVAALSEVESTTERLAEDASRRDDRLESLEGTVTELAREVESAGGLERSVSRHDDRLADLEEAVGDLQSGQERVDDLLRTIAEEVTNVPRANGEGTSGEGTEV